MCSLQVRGTSQKCADSYERVCRRHPGLQIRSGGLVPSQVSPIPMYFRGIASRMIRQHLQFVDAQAFFVAVLVAEERFDFLFLFHYILTKLPVKQLWHP